MKKPARYVSIGVLCVLLAIAAIVAQHIRRGPYGEPDRFSSRQQSPKEIPRASNSFANINMKPEVGPPSDEKTAQKRLAQIKLEIAELVTQHPTTAAAQEMTAILEASELKVVPGHGVYPRHTMVISGFPIVR